MFLIKLLMTLCKMVIFQEIVVSKDMKGTHFETNTVN